MANGRNQGRSKGDAGRDAGGFVAIPWSVLDSAAYRGLSHPAKALLIEIARQFVRDNNGRLLASAAYLSARGWNSADVITRAKRELIDARLIHETVKGHRPNKASWYAATWRALDRHPGYDPGTATTFERGAYKVAAALTITPTRDENFAKWRRPPTALENAMLRPSPGAEKARIAPSGGAGAGAAAPSPGAMAGCFGGLPTPSGGNHLERPSAVQRVGMTRQRRTRRRPMRSACGTVILTPRCSTP